MTDSDPFSHYSSIYQDHNTLSPQNIHSVKRLAHHGALQVTKTPESLLDIENGLTLPLSALKQSAR